jgi:hypothetical protein
MARAPGRLVIERVPRIGAERVVLPDEHNRPTRVRTGDAARVEVVLRAISVHGIAIHCQKCKNLWPRPRLN